MFIGHFAVGLAAKKAAPKASLGTLFLSVQLVDLLWPIFLILDLEHFRVDPGNTVVMPFDLYDYPITHSLLTGIGWGALLGFGYYILKKDTRTGLILGAGVLSHWILDFITHRPDMPIVPGMNLYAGLGLWNSVAGTMIVEATIFVTGMLIYARTTKATDRIGRWGFYSLMGFLFFSWLMNIFGPPPPDAEPVKYLALLLWLFIPWAYWVDKHRRAGNDGEFKSGN